MRSHTPRAHAQELQQPSKSQPQPQSSLPQRPSWLASFIHRHINVRVLLMQGMNFLLVLGTAMAIWKGMMVASGSESPIVVVLSGSMEPAYYRGDLLFLWNDHAVPLEVGEVMVFSVPGRDIPIVHRILEVRDEGVRVSPSSSASSASSSIYGAGTIDDAPEVKMLTKGDHNSVDDRGLYNQDMLWLKREHVIGRARFFLPYVGIVTIIMNDYPFLKVVLIGVMGLFVVLNKDGQ